jgi:hypothetical protein
MIRNLQHARAVQARREAVGKPGIAKAVRRWFWRTGGKYEELVRK